MSVPLKALVFHATLSGTYAAPCACPVQGVFAGVAIMLAISLVFVVLETVIYQFRFTRTPLKCCRRLNICCGYHYEKDAMASEPHGKWSLSANLKIVGRVQKKLQRFNRDSASGRGSASGRNWVANPLALRKRGDQDSGVNRAASTQPSGPQESEVITGNVGGGEGATLDEVWEAEP